ncbi:hypothetical protein M405DRAFT_812276 [Rhizopogon salebrosus TDB-379]|nr:hypothetical protein M405DRAFT_812276 [Rhizopogon salebrosus TDB-379]
MEFESVRQLHRALSIPELLNNILGLMERDENVVNACVCKQWSDIALDLIWREVVSLPRLLNILRPRQIQGYNASDGLPDLRDWARFQKYANRVRILRYKQGAVPVDHYNINVLNDMAMMRPKFEILPNLHTLEWLFHDVNWMKRVMLFMHQRVRHLVISVPPESYTAKSSFFLDVCCRMPHLHSLDLRAPYAARVIEADVVKLLRGLPDLEKVIFPEHYFTSIIVSELSRMKHINSMQYVHGSKQGFWEEEEDPFAPVLEEGAFPMLQELHINARLEDITRFMNTDFSPINIMSLSIDTYVEHEPEQLHMLLVTLSDRCHLLSELCISLMHVSAPLELCPAHQITFDTLRPVLSFRNLTAFEVFHKYPINITLEEIEELASRWPSLKSLCLNEEPLVMSDFTLDLRALLPFARHCPNLYRLGLFMDATTVKMHPMQELKPFTALRVLCAGTSLARHPEAVAAFLSHICPPGCEIEMGLVWPTVIGHSYRSLDEDVLSEMQNRSSHWQTVHDVLPILIRLQRDEKERSKALIAALQEEVEDLRTRNRLLTLKSNQGQ